VQADARVPLRLRRKPSQADADAEHGQQENCQQKNDNCDMAEPPPAHFRVFCRHNRVSMRKRRMPPLTYQKKNALSNPLWLRVRQLMNIA
jgi:hypothetical protein